MTTLWGMSPSMKSLERHMRLASGEQPKFEWLNRTEYCDYLDDRPGGRDEHGLPRPRTAGMDLSGAPMPRLRCSDRRFAPNLIFEGELFVSARLSQALALDTAAAQYLHVDCSECPPAMQGMGYRLLNPLAYANPIDRRRVHPQEFMEFDSPEDGSPPAWLPQPWQPGRPIPRILWRDGFTAPAPLFRVPGWTELATDVLAEHVMRAGFGDVMFLDMTNDGTRTEGLILRELA